MDNLCVVMCGINWSGDVFDVWLILCVVENLF